MQFLKCSMLANQRHHDRIGGPVLRGVGLVPSPASSFETFRAIGGGVEVFTAEQVEQHCLAIVANAVVAAQAFRTRLRQHVVRCTAFVKEAERIAETPIVGDEAETIRGMIGAVDGALGENAPDTRDAGHLAAVLNAAEGFSKAAIRTALTSLKDELAAADALRDELTGIKTKLLGAIDRAQDPRVIEAARTKKVSTKLLRVVPQALDELRAMRAETTAMLARLDRILAGLGSAA